MVRKTKTHLIEDLPFHVIEVLGLGRRWSLCGHIISMVLVEKCQRKASCLVCRRVCKARSKKVSGC